MPSTQLSRRLHLCAARVVEVPDITVEALHSMHQSLVTGLSHGERLKNVAVGDLRRRPRRSYGIQQSVGPLCSASQNLHDRGEDQVETRGVPCPIQQDVGGRSLIENVLTSVIRRQTVKSRLQIDPRLLVASVVEMPPARPPRDPGRWRPDWSGMSHWPSS